MEFVFSEPVSFPWLLFSFGLSILNQRTLEIIIMAALRPKRRLPPLRPLVQLQSLGPKSSESIGSRSFFILSSRLNQRPLYNKSWRRRHSRLVPRSGVNSSHSDQVKTLFCLPRQERVLHLVEPSYFLWYDQADKQEFAVEN